MFAFATDECNPPHSVTPPINVCVAVFVDRSARIATQTLVGSNAATSKGTISGGRASSMVTTTVAFQHWNSPWMLDTDEFAAECRKIEALQPSAIAGAHSPAIEATHVAQAFDMLRQVDGVPAPPRPGQIVLEDIVATMTGSMKSTGEAK